MGPRNRTQAHGRASYTLAEITSHPEIWHLLCPCEAREEARLGRLASAILWMSRFGPLPLRRVQRVNQGGQQNDGNTAEKRVFLELSLHITSVHSGHHDVQYDRVGLEASRGAESQRRIVLNLDFKLAGLLEIYLEKLHRK